MRKLLCLSLSMFMSLGLLFSPVYAEENVNDSFVQEDTMEDNKDDEIIEVEDEVVMDCAMTSEGLVNYIALEGETVVQNNVQKVAISFGNGMEELSNVKLTYTNGIDTFEMPFVSHDNNVYVFEQVLNNVGNYRVVSFIYTQNGVENVVNLDQIDATTEFEVIEGEEGIHVVESTDSDVIENDVVDAFGSVEVKRNENGNVVIVLDPGHGGSDPGAVGNGVVEAECNYDIALYCKEELEKYAGVEVYLTRKRNELIDPVNKAATIASKYNPTVLVSLHNNGGPASMHGACVIYPNKNYNPAVSKVGQALSQKILDELLKLGLYNMGVWTRDLAGQYPDGSTLDYYAICREAKKLGFPGIIVEHAFVSNYSDAKNYLTTQAQLKKLGIADANGIVKYFGLTKGTWQEIDGQLRFVNKDGIYPVSCWKHIGDSWYYFNEEGFAQKGWLEENGKTYYMNESCQMQTGWQNIENAWYYFNSDMKTGWQKVNNKWYYFNDKGIMQTGMITDASNKTYLLDANGAMVYGWQKVDGCWYYFNSDMKTDWQKINNKWYYFNDKGIMQTGMITDASNKTYLLDANGAMVKGWQKVDGCWYYFNSDMKTDWQKVNNKWYYFNDKGIMQTGMITDASNKTYLLDTNGAMVKGWQLVDGCWYYFNSDMKTGWQKVNNKWYYFNDKGIMQTGKVEIEGQLYSFTKDGAFIA